MRFASLPLAVLSWSLAAHAFAQGVMVGWDVHEIMSMGLWRTESKIRLPPVTVWLDENGHGMSEPILAEFQSNLELMPEAASHCVPGALVNQPLQIEVTRREDRFEVTIHRTGEPPHRVVSCSPPYQNLERAFGVATARGYPTNTPFPAARLQPGEPFVVDLAAMYSGLTGPYELRRDDLSLMLIPCEPRAGSSGDGSIRFVSHPGFDVRPWPMNETQVSFKELNSDPNEPCGQPAGDWLQFGDTGCSIAGTQSCLPQSDLGDREERAGGGRCYWFDTVESWWPTIEMRVAREVWQARDQQCWYGSARLHESRHVLDLEESFRRAQRELAAFLASGAVPTPAKPVFVRSTREKNVFTQRYLDKLQEIKGRLSRLQIRRGAGVDEAHEVERPPCAYPSGRLPRSWCR